jgi:hypothetical protein
MQITVVANYGTSSMRVRLILLKSSLARKLSAGSDRKSSQNSIVLLSQRFNFKRPASHALTRNPDHESSSKRPSFSAIIRP